MRAFEKGVIDPSARVSPLATLGHAVTIGANSIIYDNVTIGEGSIVGPNCILGEPNASYYAPGAYVNPHLSIGPQARIRSGSIIYAGSTIGEQFECGHRVTIREKSAIGISARIGTLCDIQGDCVLGDYVRLHSSVHIGMHASVGNFVWLFPFVVITNDPHPPSNVILGVTIENFAVLATKAVILPGVCVGRDALVGAGALVRSSVPPEAVVVGNPARQVGNVTSIRAKDTGEPVYPWRYHFERGMPWEGLGFDVWAARNPHYTRGLPA